MYVVQINLMTTRSGKCSGYVIGIDRIRCSTLDISLISVYGKI